MNSNKILLIIILFLGASIKSIYGQGSNLQFSRIIQLYCPATWPGHSDTLKVTVPAGRIWKITSVLTSGGTAGQGESLSVYSINGIVCNTQLAGDFLTFQFTGYSGKAEPPVLPFWLGENDRISFIYWDQVGNHDHSIINVTEYYIVP
jgi:hypothetical protein